VRVAHRTHFFLGTFLALLACATPAGAATRYVFTTFYGDAAADEKLSVYTSTDGLAFKLLSDTGYGGPTGVLRDPSIMRHTDGKYYVAYTLQSWTTNSMNFGIANNTDLEKWTFVVEVPAGVTNAHDTWAPEWFKDTDGVHLIVNIDTLGNDSDFRSYDFKATSDDLKSWDPPVALDIGPNNIDTFVVKSGATYHAFSKNETTKYIEHATASSFHGPWTWVGKNDWAGWGSGKEGIALFQLDDGTWRMFLDCYGGCGFLYADSADLDAWTATKTVPGGLSGTVRHGTVLREETGMGGTGTGGIGGIGGNAGAAGRGSSGGAGTTGSAGDGGRGGTLNASGGATAGGSAGSVPASGGRGGNTSGAGTTNGGRASAGTTGGVTSGGTTAAEPPANGGETSGCGCALPRRESRAAWLAALGAAVLALRRRGALNR